MLNHEWFSINYNLLTDTIYLNMQIHPWIHLLCYVIVIPSADLYHYQAMQQDIICILRNDVSFES